VLYWIDTRCHEAFRLVRAFARVRKTDLRINAECKQALLSSMPILETPIARAVGMHEYEQASAIKQLAWFRPRFHARDSDI
jgi:hypothetical protein